MNFRRLSATDADELTDSILVTIAAQGANEPSAGVIWMAEGNVVSDEGPFEVPAAMSSASKLAEEQGKSTVFVLCRPHDLIWQDEWGVVN